MKNVETNKKRTYPVGLKIETDKKTWYRCDKGKREHAFKNWAAAPSRGVVVCVFLRRRVIRCPLYLFKFTPWYSFHDGDEGTVICSACQNPKTSRISVNPGSITCTFSGPSFGGELSQGFRGNQQCECVSGRDCREPLEPIVALPSFLPSFRWSRFPLHPLTGFSVVLLSLAPEIFVAWR